jgi:hypothetical protein
MSRKHSPAPAFAAYLCRQFRQRRRNGRFIHQFSPAERLKRHERAPESKIPKKLVIRNFAPNLACTRKGGQFGAKMHGPRSYLCAGQQDFKKMPANSKTYLRAFELTSASNLERPLRSRENWKHRFQGLPPIRPPRRYFFQFLST